MRPAQRGEETQRGSILVCVDWGRRLRSEWLSWKEKCVSRIGAHGGYLLILLILISDHIQHDVGGPQSYLVLLRLLFQGQILLVRLAVADGQPVFQQVLREVVFLAEQLSVKDTLFVNGRDLYLHISLVDVFLAELHGLVTPFSVPGQVLVVGEAPDAIQQHQNVDLLLVDSDLEPGAIEHQLDHAAQFRVLQVPEYIVRLGGIPAQAEEVMGGISLTPTTSDSLSGCH